MKLSELIKMLEEDFDKWKDADVNIYAEGTYEHHYLTPCGVTRGVSYCNNRNDRKISIRAEYLKKPKEEKRGEQWRVAVQLVVEFPVWEQDIDDLAGFKAYIEPYGGNSGDYLCKFTIELTSHRIVSWNSKVGASCYLFYKVVDTGTYTLIGKDGTILKANKGYIPNRLIPPSNGYGDYIELHVDADGTITNWYEEVSFDQFDEFEE